MSGTPHFGVTDTSSERSVRGCLTALIVLAALIFLSIAALFVVLMIYFNQNHADTIINNYVFNNFTDDVFFSGFIHMLSAAVKSAEIDAAAITSLTAQTVTVNRTLNTQVSVSGKDSFFATCSVAGSLFPGSVNGGGTLPTLNMWASGYGVYSQPSANGVYIQWNPGSIPEGTYLLMWSYIAGSGFGNVDFYVQQGTLSAFALERSTQTNYQGPTEGVIPMIWNFKQSVYLNVTFRWQANDGSNPVVGLAGSVSLTREY